MKPEVLGGVDANAGKAERERVQAFLRQRFGEQLASPEAQSVLAHGEGCAGILAQLGADPAAILAAGLFGLPKLLPLPVIEREFGDEVARIVESMRKLRRLREISLSKPRAQGEAGRSNRSDRTAEARLETLRRMLLAMSVDVRVVLLRLASRLQTLRRHAESGSTPPIETSLETLEVLAPLANRLGIGALKWQLEDLAFRFLRPDEYRSLAGSMKRTRIERERLVTGAIEQLQVALQQASVRGSVFGRSKHLYSLANKMAQKALSVEQVHDLHALRVIVKDIPACYRALDVVHDQWAPLIDQFSDYISAPKSNGYQSLHTIVQNTDGVVLEVQIRTEEMDEAAEYGRAAHWQYKEGATASTGAGGGFEQRVAWLRQLLVWQREIGQALGASTISGQPDSTVYSLTPQGRVIALPGGATPVDFAYHLHTELGHRCRGAKVNGSMVPLTHTLHTGDTVEIVAAKGQSAADAGPSRDWLNSDQVYLVSHRARGKVRHWFAAQEAAREQQQGRSTIDRAIQREGAGSVSLEKLVEYFRAESLSHLCTLVFKGEVGPRAIEQALRALLAHGAASGSTALMKPAAAIGSSVNPAQLADKAARVQGAGVLIEGVGALMTQLAKCCRPVPPDEIGGFITRGKGVTVHREHCRVFQEMLKHSPERTVAATWAGAAAAGAQDARHSGRQADDRYPVDLEVTGGAAAGLMQRVAEILAREQIPLLQSESQQRGEHGLLRITVALTSAQALPALLSRLQQSPDVSRAKRL
ncbi:MAG: bifunctional (p)ppGpp synthetase/guanosine-3',5'-bis(diphosphate) 3'-pyrophosphohydrolase [Burkholderiaceae bacterium]